MHRNVTFQVMEVLAFPMTKRTIERFAFNMVVGRCSSSSSWWCFYWRRRKELVIFRIYDIHMYIYSIWRWKNLYYHFYFKPILSWENKKFFLHSEEKYCVVCNLYYLGMSQVHQTFLSTIYFVGVFLKPYFFRNLQLNYILPIIQLDSWLRFACIYI